MDEDFVVTPKQIDLVQASWVMVLPIKDSVANLFYGKIFDLDPGLQTLFRGDMKVQGRKLISFIGLAISSLGRVDNIIPGLRELGRKHLDYGVKDSDYDTFGAALIWALEQGLGEAFSVDVRNAWIQTYELLAGVMKDAAADEATYVSTD